MEQVSDEVHGLRVAIRERILRIPDAVSDAGYDDLPITQLLAPSLPPFFRWLVGSIEEEDSDRGALVRLAAT